MMDVAPPTPAQRAQEAWEANARCWTEAVRGYADPVRRLTDRSIVSLIRQVPTGPILDAGCGEGWLVRELAGHGHTVTGIDASEGMIEQAKRAGSGNACRVLSFLDGAAHPRKLEGPYGTIVFNFSLLEQQIAPILEASGEVLFPYGRVLIQAAHPLWAVEAGEPYKDGWKSLERGPGDLPLSRPVPWYFRTFTTWVREIRQAGLILLETVEPLDPKTGRPVSLILSATIPERRKG